MSSLQVLTRLQKVYLGVYDGCRWPTLRHLPPSVQKLELWASGRVGSGKCLVDITQLIGLKELKVTAADGFAEGSALPACAPVVILSETPLPERPWQLLAGVQQLQIYRPDDKPAGGIAQLSRLQSLTSLSLSCRSTSYAAAAAAAWKHLPQLQSLHFSMNCVRSPENQSKCEDFVRAISMVKSLTSLRVTLPLETTLPWAVYIAQLQNLQQLILVGVNSSRQDLMQLRKMTQLRTLGLYRCSMDDAAAVAVFSRLTNLQSLKVIQGNKKVVNMSDAVIPALEQLKGLRQLSLSVPGVGENSVVLLEGLTQLTGLGVMLSQERRQQLGRVLGCRVSYPWF
jgi:Leucine-rich repeat (LRR) protein